METKRNADQLFTEFYWGWLKHHRFFIAENTYNAYVLTANKHIIPYFSDQNIFLNEVNEDLLKDYYFHKLNQGLSSNTIRKHHANIHSALEVARQKRLIAFNPATGIKLPKNKCYRADVYSHDEVIACVKLFEGHELETCVLFGAILGLRRSEVLGVQWKDINFTNSTITIRNVVVASNDTTTGKSISIFKTTGKSKNSFRTLVLPEFIVEHLQKIMHTHKKTIKPTSPVCTRFTGEAYYPEYVTRHFKTTLQKSNLRTIRFHDLRHSCATMLFNWGYSLKDIQMWLGHSDIQTTANIYTHYSLENKSNIADKYNDTFASKAVVPPPV